MKLIISSDTYLKRRPERPDFLADEDKIPLQVGDWLEIEVGAEYPKNHYQVKIDGEKWYCYKFNSFLED